MSKIILSLVFLMSPLFAQVDTMIVQARQKIVKVISLNPFQTSQGSGVYIANGVILTENHVIGSNHDDVFVYDERWTDLKPAIVVYTDERLDFAVLSIKDKGNQQAIFSKDFRVGQAVFATGNPLMGDFTFAPAKIKGIYKIGGRSMIRVDSELIGPGFSGTPIFNDEGYVLGLLELCERGTEIGKTHACFAIPSTEIISKIRVMAVQSVKEIK